MRGYEAAFLGAGLAVVVSLICVIALPYEEKAAAEPEERNGLYSSGTFLLWNFWG